MKLKRDTNLLLPDEYRNMSDYIQFKVSRGSLPRHILNFNRWIFDENIFEKRNQHKTNNMASTYATRLSLKGKIDFMQKDNDVDMEQEIYSKLDIIADSFIKNENDMLVSALSNISSPLNKKMWVNEISLFTCIINGPLTERKVVDRLHNRKEFSHSYESISTPSRYTSSSITDDTIYIIKQEIPGIGIMPLWDHSLCFLTPSDNDVTAQAQEIIGLYFPYKIDVTNTKA